MCQYGEKFCVGLDTIHPPDIYIPLVVLTSTSSLSSLVTPALGDRIPLDWERQSARPRHYHSCQRGRHLGPECYSSPALILKIVQLADYLLSCLARVQILTLKHRGIVLLKPVRTCSRVKSLEEPVAHAHIIWIEVARATNSLSHSVEGQPIVLQDLRLSR